MPQVIIFLDEVENRKVERVAFNFHLSKQEAIRRIIREGVDDEEGSK
jgi:hypothetical protein